MKIMTISDLYWDHKITESQLKKISTQKLDHKQFKRIREYYNMVMLENPDLLIMAGDISGDGFCGSGFHYSLCALIKLVTANQITVLIIPGNHDIESSYNIVLEYIKENPLAFDISNKLHDFNGLKIFGLPFESTKYKKTLNEITKTFNATYIDILVAHSEKRRRTHLFNFNAKYIITGHYDNKIACIDKKIFISLSNDYHNSNYCTLELGNQSKVTYIFTNYGDKYVRLVEDLENLCNGISNGILVDSESNSVHIEHYENNPGNPLLSYNIEYFSLKERFKFVQAKVAELESNGLKHFERERYALKNLRGSDFKIALENIFQYKLTGKSDVALSELKVSKEVIRDYLGMAALEK